MFVFEVRVLGSGFEVPGSEFAEECRAPNLEP
jgi:hypothetical protein